MYESTSLYERIDIITSERAKATQQWSVEILGMYSLSNYLIDQDDILGSFEQGGLYSLIVAGLLYDDLPKLVHSGCYLDVYDVLEKYVQTVPDSDIVR